MLVSILHRVTGSGMATVGTLLLVWWLAALAGGAESYATFLDVFTTDSGSLEVVVLDHDVGRQHNTEATLAPALVHVDELGGRNTALLEVSWVPC